MTAQPIQVSPSNATRLADMINAAHHDGATITVNGETPKARPGTAAARAYLNGTLSYKVAAKKPGALREVFVKIGHMVTIDIQDDAPTRKPRKPATAPTSPATPTDTSNLIEATRDGITGWLMLLRREGKFDYTLTQSEKDATQFTPGASLDRHRTRAEAKGYKVI